MSGLLKFLTNRTSAVSLAPTKIKLQNVLCGTALSEVVTWDNVVTLSDNKTITGNNTFSGTTTFSGAVNISGTVTDTSINVYLSATGLAALGGGGQSGATLIAAEINEFTTVALAGDSAELPVAVKGMKIQVTNSGIADLAVFPNTGGTIDAGSANASITIPVGATKVFEAMSGTAWITNTKIISAGAGTAARPSQTFDTQSGMGNYVISATSMGTSVAGAKVTATTTAGFDVTGATTTSTTLNVGTNQTFTKEVNHILSVSDSTTVATAGGNLSIIAGAGTTSGTGGNTSLSAGAGAVNGASGSSSGTTTITTGIAGTATTGTGGSGGNLSVTGIAGGAASGAAGTGGGGSNISIVSGAGGATTSAAGGAETGGAGGALQLSAGAGGALNASSIGTSGAGNSVSISSGASGAAAGGTSAAAGNVTITAANSGNATTAGNAGNITITAGNAGSGGTTGLGGNVTLTPGTTNSTTVSPIVILGKNVVTKRPTASVASGATITGKQIVDGYIEGTGATGNWQMPTAAQITTAIGATPAGTTVEFTFNATNMTATNVATLLVGANIVAMKQTSSGDSATSQLLTITQTSGLQMGIFRLVYDTSTTCTLHRIG